MSSAAARIAYVTLTAVARVMAYTRTDCTECGHWLALLPGRVLAEVRKVAGTDTRSGRGPVVRCSRCGATFEVIEHGG
jgi:DNA-directed RNA polymerase subunit RPC12/RpoP